MKCLDKAQVEGTTLKVPSDAAAITENGLLICDSSFNYTTAPDIVLIMDNTGSMARITEVDGLPRYCDKANPAPPDDPACISGDPDRMRGPALRTFLDSALAKGGKGVNVGVVTFAEQVLHSSGALRPLNASTIDSIKSSIVMSEGGQTNYSAAFRVALDLLETSRKPKSEQFVIFVSDGRPNLPKQSDGGVYLYKEFWDELPPVHSIFLGDNADNYKDMQDISGKTGGLFFNIRDVGELAGILTDDIAKTLFRRATPTFTTVSNLTTKTVFQLAAERHEAVADSGAYVLRMPGPLYLAPGVNEVVVKTEYGYGGSTQDVHFKVERSADGPFAGLEQACRERATLRLYNGKDEAINVRGLPYLFADTSLRFSLTTAAPLESVTVEVKVASGSTAQQDREGLDAGPSAKVDSTWSGSAPFQHQTLDKSAFDGKVQIDHGEIITATWRHPYIPEDSAQAIVRMKYGPEFDEAAYWDLDGDGRIETVRIRFRESLSALPDRLAFTIKDPAGTHNRAAAGSEIAFRKADDGSEDRKSLVVTLSNPFPMGVTSVLNPEESGQTFRQNEIPLMDGRFRVDDSAAPVIVKAAVRGPDRDNPLTRVVVTYSEPVTLADVSLEPVVFKRDTVVFDRTQIPVSRPEKLGEREWAFHLQDGADFSPVGGDSVAINNNGETSDLAGRTPKTRVFAPVQGGAPTQSISGFYVTFANGSKSDPVAFDDAAPSGNGFIPVDSKGHPIQGSSDGKCGGCDPGEEGRFGGSVIHVITKQPVTYELSVYTNLGEPVTRTEGKVTEEDLRLLERKMPAGSNDPNDAEYVQRIVWTGIASNGQVVGTGAYVLKAVFKYDKSFRTGAKAATNTRITRFGFIRKCCATVNDRWYY
jgi:hypothetical protein